MDLTFAVTIVLAIAGGLTVIAFQAPEVFEKLGVPLLLAILAGLIGSFAFVMGMHVALMRVADFFEPGKYWEARNELWPDPPWVLPPFLIAFAYVRFLAWLAQARKNKSSAKPGVDEGTS